MALTQQKDTAQYIATMETAYRATENQSFYNIPQSCYPRSGVSGYPTDNTTVPNDSLSRVNGSGQKTGPSLLLRVMSGDVVDVATKSFYKSGGTKPGNTSPFTDILNALAGGVSEATAGSHGTTTDLSGSGSPIYSALNAFLPANNPDPALKPKAYLNWILLDDQFKDVTTYPQSGAIVVGSADVLNTLAYSGIPITKNGYLYIWVSNETQGWDVFFDNLSVKHYSGPITEENHYYLFGLTMAGISSKSAGGIENRYKYNGKEIQNKEFSDGSGLEMYDFKYRFYDMQLGRFFNQDRLADKFAYMSPYQFCSNNPIWLREIDGLEGLKYTEVDKDGNKKTVVEKNVIVLVDKKKDIPAGATQKTIDKITKKNEKIEANNASRIASVKTELNKFYNGSNSKGSQDSKDEPVQFKFNVTGMAVANTNGGTDQELTKIALDNGLKSSETVYDGGPNKIAPAAIITTAGAGGAQGLSNGVFVKLNYGSPEGAMSHEVGHTFLLKDDYSNGGIMASPPNQVISSEVDEIINQSYAK